MKRLEGQTALVTGAGRGIGKAVALALAEAGARVIVTARTEAELQAVAQTITSAGGSALVKTSDISDERSVADLFAFVTARAGALDILINNAGIGLFGPLAEFDAADFDRVIAVNVRGAFLCCKAAVNLMKRKQRGYIITIASVVGFKGYPGQSAYTASKHGVMGLTKSLAREVHTDSIRVSAILPGGVDTGMVGDARPDLDTSMLMKPDDIAQAVMYLLSLSDRAAVDEIYIRRSASAPFR